MAAALRAYAKGVCAAEAAVELLIGQLPWLAFDDLLGGSVEVFDGLAGGVLASVDWPGLAAALDGGRLVCSGGQARVLRVAASLGGGVGVDLGEVLGGLDAANAGRLAEAVVHAAGYRRCAAAGAGAAR